MKLLVTEPGSDLAHDAAEAAELLASSEIAYVEARSALARMRAGDGLDALGHERQRSAFGVRTAVVAHGRRRG